VSILLEHLKISLKRRFEIDREIDRGGSAYVYVARDVKHERPVAVKVLRPDVAESVGKERFLREIRITARLHHPNILPLHDSGETSGFVYYVMPYVEAGSLRDRLIRKGSLPIRQALQIVGEVADALEYAHKQGVLHRDLKPENILLSEGHASVGDFGIAQAMRASEARDTTQTGVVVGTPSYMSPEQMMGEPDLDARSDIYSLGCVLYEMLSGELPPPGAPMQALLARLHQDHKTTGGPGADVIPGFIEEALRKALAPTRAERFGSAAEFAKALTPPAPGSAGAELVPGSRIRSLAVLPLRNLSGDPNQEYFADGMTEELISVLAKLGALRVISRTSIMRYKGTDKLLPEIAAELRVDGIIEGSVLRGGDRVRVTAQLIDASSDTSLWSESYERDIRDILALQSEVAQAIAQGVQLKLTPEERARLEVSKTVDPVAHEAYLQGRYHWNRRTKDSLLRAVDFFLRAVQKDQKYALAYAGLGDAYTILGHYSFLSPFIAFPSGTAAARRALAIDESLGPAHTSLASALAQHERDWDGAEREYLKGIELSPGYATAHHWYGLHLSFKGQLDAGMAQLRQAEELDPLSLPIKADVGQVLMFQGRRDEAIAVLESALEMDPQFQLAQRILALVLVQKGSHEEAIRRARESGASTVMAQVLAVAGREQETLGVLTEIEASWEEEGVSPTEIGLAHANLGRKTIAFDWLGKGHEHHDPRILHAKVEPLFNPLRDDKRFRDLIQLIGLPIE
jgi:serine/threonine-protein kinase